MGPTPSPVSGARRSCWCCWGTKLDEAWHVAERLRERTVALGVVMQGGGTGPALTASFGVAAHRPGDTWDGLLARAADALQRAKRTGRNRCEVA